MTRAWWDVRTTFEGGELSPDAEIRRDLKIYERACRLCRNLWPKATGGLVRRAGTMALAKMAALGGTGRRFYVYSPRPGAYYVLMFSVDGGNLVAYFRAFDLSAPVTSAGWNLLLSGTDPGATPSPSVSFDAALLGELVFAPIGERVLLLHQSMPPQVLSDIGGSWPVRLNPLAFDTVDFSLQRIHCGPMARYAPYNVALAWPALTKGAAATVTASGPAWFTADHVGTHLLVPNNDGALTVTLKITAVSGASLTVEPGQDLDAQDEMTVWQESAFSPIGGYPAAAVFHGNRLWFGGTPRWTLGLWGSEIGEYFKFRTGVAKDDEAIVTRIGADERATIRHMASRGRRLEIFADNAEYALSDGGAPRLTPTTHQIETYSKIGTRNVAPVVYDGASMFVGALNPVIYEFAFNPQTFDYMTEPVSLLAEHLVNEPQRMVVYTSPEVGGEVLLLIANVDGTVTWLRSMRSNGVTQWGLWEFAFPVEDLFVVDDQLLLMFSGYPGSDDFVLAVLDWSKALDVSELPNGATVDVSTAMLSQYFGNEGAPVVARVGHDLTVVTSSLQSVPGVTEFGFTYSWLLQTTAPDKHLQGRPQFQEVLRTKELVVEVEELVDLFVDGERVRFRDDDGSATLTGSLRCDIDGVGRSQAPALQSAAAWPTKILGVAIAYTTGS